LGLLERSWGSGGYSGVVSDAPIGMFDSGFGGLTVARAVIDLLPGENLVYLGDTARYPYGARGQDEVGEFAAEIAEYLLRQFDVKYVVIACNTATAAALQRLKDELPIPVMGVIKAGVNSLLAASREGRVGVIGTVGTVESGAYQRAIAEVDPSAHVTACACPGFVEFVERGITSGREVELLADRLLAPIREAGVDALLLGCTHYPYLARVISRVLAVGHDPSRLPVVLVSSADECAFALADDLAERNLLRRGRNSKGSHRFVSSGDVRSFTDIGSRLFGPELIGAERWPRE